MESAGSAAGGVAKKVWRQVPTVTGLAAAVALTRAPEAVLSPLHLDPLAAAILQVQQSKRLVLRGSAGCSAMWTCRMCFPASQQHGTSCVSSSRACRHCRCSHLGTSS